MTVVWWGELTQCVIIIRRSYRRFAQARRDVQHQRRNLPHQRAPPQSHHGRGGGGGGGVGGVCDDVDDAFYAHGGEQRAREGVRVSLQTRVLKVRERDEGASG